MRKIVFYGAISLDGFLSTKTDDLQWLFDMDLQGTSTYDAFEQTFDTMVMGRTTYEETLKIMGDAPFYPGKQKIIFSHHSELTTDGEVVVGDPVPILKQLQQKSGQDIWIVGGGQLVTQLLEAGMIDEFYIQIAPVLLGQGKRLFENGDYTQRLDLVKTTQIGELTELHLRPRR